MTTCENCGSCGRRRVRAPQVADREGRVALVLDVPAGECTACGTIWLDEPTVQKLTVMFREMLASPVEVATRHFDALTTQQRSRWALSRSGLSQTWRNPRSWFGGRGSVGVPPAVAGKSVLSYPRHTL